MTLPAWDLDAPVSTERVTSGAGPGSGSGLVLVLAIGLAGLGLGSLAGSALTPPAAPQFPATATLNIRDLYVDTSASAPTTGPSAAPANGPIPRIGDAVVVLRLQVDNPGGGLIRVTGLELRGVTKATRVLPLDLRVAGHGSATADLTVHPDCSPTREPEAVRAWLRVIRPGRSDPDVVRIAPSRTLIASGGLCSDLENELPNGWRTPLQVITTRQEGLDLEITIDDLSGARLAGILVNDRLLPTVFVGDQLLSSSAELRPGQATQLRLHGPPPCVQFTGTTPVPGTIRILAQGDEGLQQWLVIVGPELTRWLRLGCS